MSPSKKHEDTAKRIAKKLRTEYNPGKGADIQSGRATVEVETPGNVRDGIRQLRGYKGPVYIAAVDEKTKEEALQATKNTTIGVMDNKGNILKSSSRKKK